MSLVRVVIEPLVIALVVLLIGLVSLALAAPLLIPATASAVFSQVMTPKAEHGQPWNIAAGQALGAGFGIAGVHLAGATGLAEFGHGHPLLLARVLAGTLAALLTAVTQRLLRATCAAGAATALVVSLGAETANWPGAGRLALGIALVTALGEAGRLAMLRLR